MTTRDLCREARATLILATPIVIGQVSQMLMGLTDSVMIGQVGKVALAGSAFAGNVFGIFYILGIGFLQPFSVLVAREEGAARPDGCASCVRHGMAGAFLFACLQMAGMGGVGLFLDDLGQPPEVVAEARSYYFIIAASILPVMVFQVLRQFAEAMHRPWLPMAILLGGVVLNMGLNWLLIYGHWGFPALGLTGAGWATLIARVLSALLLWVWLARAPALAAVWVRRWFGGWERAKFAEMIRLGVPASGQLLFEGGAFTAAAVMIGWLGTVPLAAHQIAISCAATTFMFMLGISVAVSIRVGQALGAGQRERLRPVGTSALLVCFLGMSGFALVFLLAGRLIASGFVDDEAVVALAAQLLAVAGIFQIFDGGQVVGSGILRGMHDVRIPTAITFLAYWGIALPAGYWWGVHQGYGALALWVALAVGLAVAAVLFAWRFARLTAAFAK